MYLLLVILMVIASILMCFIVLIQNSKGGGLASGFSSSNQIMGVRKTTDFLEKATWSLAVFLVVMSVASAYVIPSASHIRNDSQPQPPHCHSPAFFFLCHGRPRTAVSRRTLPRTDYPRSCQQIAAHQSVLSVACV